MIINCRISDKTSHTVCWLRRQSSNMFNPLYNKYEEVEKDFDSFMDASGFMDGLVKRGITVTAIINNLKSQ